MINLHVRSRFSMMSFLVVIFLLFSLYVFQGCVEFGPRIGSIKGNNGDLKINLEGATSNNSRIDVLVLVASDKTMTNKQLRHKSWNELLKLHTEWSILDTILIDNNNISSSQYIYTVDYDFKEYVDRNKRFLLFGLNDTQTVVYSVVDITKNMNGLP